MRHRSNKGSRADLFFIGLVALLIISGLVMLTSASSDKAESQFGDSYYYLKHQAVNGLLPGLLGFLLAFFFFYRRLTKISLIFLIINIVFMVLLFTPLGFGAKGATRWISFNGFSFQPGELLKLTFLIYLAAWLSKTGTRGKAVKGGFFPFIFLIGGIAILLLLEPATTTAVIIFFASLVMYFISGARVKFILGISFIAIFGVILLIAFGGDNYRLQRIRTFINPGSSDKLEAGYHIDQAQTAIGSGGIMGVGFGNSKSKLSYLPEPLADSIFAIIAEETGFIGSIILITIFFLLVWRGLKIARASPDSFGKALTVGFISVIGIQVFINIAAVSGIIPLTGVPLPFISYGGTSLAVFLTMCGIIANISKYRR